MNSKFLNSSDTLNKEVLEYLSQNKYFQMNELMMDKFQPAKTNLERQVQQNFVTTEMF